MAELLQTTLCYLEQNGCYLMLHRIKKKNDVNHDKWIGVGGKTSLKAASASTAPQPL